MSKSSALISTKLLELKKPLKYCIGFLTVLIKLYSYFNVFLSFSFIPLYIEKVHKNKKIIFI